MDCFQPLTAAYADLAAWTYLVGVRYHAHEEDRDGYVSCTSADWPTEPTRKEPVHDGKQHSQSPLNNDSAHRLQRHMSCSLDRNCRK